jgi:hypothetical protein
MQRFIPFGLQRTRFGLYGMGPAFKASSRGAKARDYDSQYQMKVTNTRVIVYNLDRHAKS